MLEPQEFAITNVKLITVKCNSTIKDFVLDTPGSLFLRLPCYCQVYTKANLLIDSVYPCLEHWNEFSITHNVPLIFSKNKDLSKYDLSAFRINRKNYADHFINSHAEFDRLLHRHTYFTNLNDTEYYLPLDTSNSGITVVHRNTWNDIVLYIWISLLTTFTAYVIVRFARYRLKLLRKNKMIRNNSYLGAIFGSKPAVKNEKEPEEAVLQGEKS